MATQLELRHFAALAALADAGGVGKAARQLGVAQSTLSETLLSLERALGQPVLERSPGATATLTGVARRLLPHARAILQATERARADALATPTRLRIGTVESVGSHLLPAALEACHASHPGLEIQVSVGLCEALKASFARGQADLLLTLETPRARAEGRAHAVPLVLLRGGQAPRAATDAGVLLVPDPEGALHGAASQWIRRQALPLRLVSTGTLDGVRRGLADGSAWGLLPRHAVLDDLHRGRLHPVEPSRPLPMLELRARVRRGVPAPLRTALEQLIEAIGRQLDAAA
ncbi:MAG TPA: LysR family transcriptional regulator [Frateuria sp.]|uniref:LysR family transcriptional regulator n=1 Tax=Frateuria sp. TaxID=2211372 RepID=UPI002D7E570E|nr:LysR family transcriptional regulator [Frateuria sp.]HET6806398.1 LysR family transcriptional regulator [Frateuria sp.]